MLAAAAAMSRTAATDTQLDGSCGVTAYRYTCSAPLRQNDAVRPPASPPAAIASDCPTTGRTPAEGRSPAPFSGGGGALPGPAVHAAISRRTRCSASGASHPSPRAARAGGFRVLRQLLDDAVVEPRGGERGGDSRVPVHVTPSVSSRRG
jgi:hypothetical protein